jgi:thiamine biosynthesis lipoprotein
MGTFVTVGFEKRGDSEANVIFERVFSEIRKTVALLNHYDPCSEISRLNNDGMLAHGSADTLEVIRKALYFFTISEGAFDVSALPLVRVFGHAFETGKIPSACEIADALAAVDSKSIRIENDSVRFLRPGMQISPAGIAKGFVVDKAISVLREMGVLRAVVNGGGDIRVICEEGKPPWRIGIRDPRHRKLFLDVVEACEIAVASSGHYAHAYNDIIDPRTGFPAWGVLGASVVAGDATSADALATALIVLGADKGIPLIERLRDAGVAALIVSSDGKCRSTSNWRRFCAYRAGAEEMIL